MMHLCCTARVTHRAGTAVCHACVLSTLVVRLSDTRKFQSPHKLCMMVHILTIIDCMATASAFDLQQQL